MADERDSPDDLYPFAQMLVRKLIKKHGLRWDRHRVEDAEQELFLCGWQVYQDEGDVGLAKNRMKSRTAKRSWIALRSIRTRRRAWSISWPTWNPHSHADP